MGGGVDAAPRRSDAPPRPRRSTRRTILRAALIGVTVLVLLVVLDGARLWFSVDRMDLSLPGSGRPGTTTYVLVGSDSREFVTSAQDRSSFGDTTTVPGERADVILVVRVTEGRPPLVLSIPRDLLVAVPGAAQQRIGLTLTHGPQELVDTLCSSLGIGVDHVVIVRFDGFRRVVDASGGVDVSLPAATRDLAAGLDLPAGDSHLDGERALALVRSRKAEQLVDGAWTPDPDGARNRQVNARKVLGPLGAQLAAKSGPLDSLRLAHAAAGSGRVDAGFGRPSLEQLRDALTQAAAPPTGAARPASGGGATAAPAAPTGWLELPSRYHDGDLPSATLDPTALPVLAALASPGSGCHGGGAAVASPTDQPSTEPPPGAAAPSGPPSTVTQGAP